MSTAAACGTPSPPGQGAGDPCSGTAVRAPDGECVGVSAGALNFTGDPAFADVLNRIKQENARVAALPGSSMVAVVYALPLPRQHDELSSQLLHELMGAHLLQLRANNATDLAGKPYVQILVANFGENAEQWPSVVPKIKELVDPARPGHVVAVAGLGQSLVPVRDALRSLAQERIPMVPARLTAGNISPSPGTDGVFRIAPPNSSQATAASSYLADACRPLLVEDVNPGDLYTRDIAASFPRLRAAADAASGCPAATPLVSERYDSSLPQVDTSFRQMMASVCVQKPDLIYYGGRGNELDAFVRALGSRPCPGPVTVVTSDDGLGLAPAVRQEIASGGEPDLVTALRGGVRVVVTGLASPGEWTARPAQFPPNTYQSLNGTCATCGRTVFPGVSLDDGDVIMGHDAMLVIVSAIRGGVSQNDTSVTSGTVLQGLLQVNQIRPVQGASGPIAFAPDGSPVAKNVPVVEVTDKGDLRFSTVK